MRSEKENLDFTKKEEYCSCKLTIFFMNKSSGITYFLIFLIVVFFAMPVWEIISGFGGATGMLATESGAQKSYPIAHFVTYAFTLTVLILLLFTPGKNLESPLYFFSSSVGKKVDMYLNYSVTDKEGYDGKAHVLTSGLVDGIFLVVMVVVYYYLIKKMNLIEGSYMYMLIFLLFVNFIVGVNSYFTKLISRADDLLKKGAANQGLDNRGYLNQKMMLAIGLMVLTILLMVGGESFSVWLSDIIGKWDLPIINWFTSPISRSSGL